MDWDLGFNGLLYLAAMSIDSGVLAHLLAWRRAPKWLWALVSAVSFGGGMLVSEFLFGWATEEDLQPNIDGLSRDEVLIFDMLLVAIVVVVTRKTAGRHDRQVAEHHEDTSVTSGV